jgi:hypothetical protein
MVNESVFAPSAIPYRVLIEGENACGKTNNAVWSAVEVLKDIQRPTSIVAYLQLIESGSQPQFSELIQEGKLPRECLPRLDWRHITVWEELEKALKEYMVKKPGLLIIDPLHWTQTLTRRFLRRKNIERGFFMDGSKQVPIDEPEIFDIAGYAFGPANDREMWVLETLQSIGCNIIATINPVGFLKDDKVAMVEGAFDNILKVTKRNEKGVDKYFAFPKKVRGARWTKSQEFEVPSGISAATIMRALASVK